METKFGTPKRWMAVLVAAVFLFQSSFLEAASRPLELKWSELDPVITAQKIALALPDGTRIKGRVLEVRPDSLLMQIRHTSNKKAHPKGLASVPRASVTEIEVTERRNSDASPLEERLAPAGFATPTFVEQPTYEPRPRRRCHDESGASFDGLGSTDRTAALVGLGILGAVVAIDAIMRAADKRVTRIKLVEDPPPPQRVVAEPLPQGGG